MASNSQRGSREFRGGSYQVVDNLAEELNLSAGQILRAWVADSLPEYPQRIFIAIKGKRTVARTKLDVDRGDELMVRVKSVGPPIELKLFRPEDAREQVDETHLKHCLEAMEFSVSEELLNVAQFLMEQHVPLTPDTISDTYECWEQISGDNNLDSDAVHAFQFLTSRNLPLNPRLLELLKYLSSEDPDEKAWDDLDFGNESPGPIWNENWEDQIRKLGIDLVNQIGKWPHTASHTIHAKILSRMERGEITPALKRKLAQLLALGLAGASGPETWVILPFQDRQNTRLMTMVVEALPEDHAWKVHARMDSTFTGNVGLSLFCTAEEWNIQLCCPEKETIEKARDRISDLKNSLEASEREVTIELTQDTPAKLNPFSSGDQFRGTDSSQSRKVDFTA